MQMMESILKTMNRIKTCKLSQTGSCQLVHGLPFSSQIISGSMSPSQYLSICCRAEIVEPCT